LKVYERRKYGAEKRFKTVGRRSKIIDDKRDAFKKYIAYHPNLSKIKQNIIGRMPLQKER
jgi:hypothetical protein